MFGLLWCKLTFTHYSNPHEHSIQFRDDRSNGVFHFVDLFFEARRNVESMQYLTIKLDLLIKLFI